MSHESTLADTYTHSTAHSDEVHLVSTRLSALPFSPDCLVSKQKRQTMLHTASSQALSETVLHLLILTLC
jgi:hypothetical protein